MRFYKFIANSLLNKEEVDKFFDNRTYAVEYQGQTVGFVSREAIGQLKILIPVDTPFSVDYEFNMGVKVRLIHKDINTAIIELGDSKNESQGTRLYFSSWIEI